MEREGKKPTGRCGRGNSTFRGRGAPSGRCALLVTLVALAAGCPAERDTARNADVPGPAPEPGRALAAEPPGETARERCQAYYRNALLVEAESRDEFRDALGEPSEAEVATEPNRHMPERTDTITVLRFAGLEAQVRTAGGRDLLEQVKVRDNRHLRYGAPAIGTSEVDLRELFDEPDRRDGDRLEYFCAPEPMPDVPVSFTVRAAEVREVTFHHYVD